MFSKETVLPASDSRSPFYVNIPPPDAKPIDHLVAYFKFWKAFIKSLIYYCKELALIKEFDANVNFQLISSVQFPSFKHLPSKYSSLIEQQQQLQKQQIQLQQLQQQHQHHQSTSSPETSGNTTPKNELRKTLSNTSLSTTNTASSSTGASTVTNSTHATSAASSHDSKRPHLFKTLSNQSFLKGSGASLYSDSIASSAGTSGSGANSSSSHSPGHKRNLSVNSLHKISSTFSSAGHTQNGNNKNHRNSHKLHLNLGSNNNTSTNLNNVLGPINRSDSNLSTTGHSRHTSSGGGNAAAVAGTPPPPVKDIPVPSNYFPEDSLFNNLAPALINHHYQLYNSQSKFHRELSTRVIPRLESLLKNLSAKIKEIKSTLKNDSFANYQLVKEISKSGKTLSTYMTSIERYSSDRPVLKKHNDDGTGEEDQGVLDDPFLVKLQVDYQLKHQLIHENYMFASYVNLQNISKELLNYVLKELSHATDRVGKLINQESVYSSATSAADLLALNLLNILKKTVPHGASPTNDWEYFVSHNTNFLNIHYSTDVSEKRHNRSLGNLVLPYQSSIHNKCLRFGIMYKKSKVFKNYTSFYYVLTCNYLHEFKLEGPAHPNGSGKTEDGSPGTPENGSSIFSPGHGGTPHGKKTRKDKIGGFIGHDDIPIKSYNLNEYVIKLKDAKSFKFALNKTTNSSQKFTFRCNNLIDYENWFADLSELMKFGKDHLARFELVQLKVQQREESMAAKRELKKQQRLQAQQQAEYEKHHHSNPAEPETPHAGNGNNADAIVTPEQSQLMSPPKSGSNSKVNQLKLNLNNLLPKQQQGQSLSGIFTPRIETPTETATNGSAGAGKEKNPFESTFASTAGDSTPSGGSGGEGSISLNIPSIQVAPLHDTGHESNREDGASPLLIATSPAGTSGMAKIPHQIEHENYLKMQQQALRQQQEIRQQQELLDLQVNPAPSESAKNEHLLGHNLSRVSSNDSINSMVHQPSSNIQSVIESNRDLIDHEP